MIHQPSVFSKPIGFLVAFAAIGSSLAVMGDEPAARRTLELTCIDDQVIHSATFQSNTQHVVSNRRGIFAAYVKSRNADYTEQNWRLVRSIDGGRNFTLVSEGIAATNPPVLETDAEDNLYLCRVDWKNNHTAIDCLSADSDYKQIRTLQLPGVAGGKFAMLLDESRKCIYFITLDGVLHRIGLDGTTIPAIELLTAGQQAILQYPSLHIDEHHHLYFCWTTVAHGKYLYYDIHVARSNDGGQRWETLAGEQLELPFAADDGGPADMISLKNECDVTTWLANALPRFGKLHALYETQSEPRRYNYVRFDTRHGKEDLRISPRFGGATLELQGLDGGLASQAKNPDASLFAVVKDAHRSRLACVRSDDQGVTWQDWAVSPEITSPYAIGTCREITQDGAVIGTFTDAIEPSNNDIGKSKIYFFRVTIRD